MRLILTLITNNFPFQPWLTDNNELFIFTSTYDHRMLQENLKEKKFEI